MAEKVAKLTEDQELAREAVIRAFEMRRLLPRKNPMRRRVEELHEEFKMLKKCGCRLCSSEVNDGGEVIDGSQKVREESPAKRFKLKN